MYRPIKGNDLRNITRSCLDLSLEIHPTIGRDNGTAEQHAKPRRTLRWLNSLAFAPGPDSLKLHEHRNLDLSS